MVALLALGLLGGLLTSTLPGVEAMGQNPSTCNNRYDGTITSFTVTYPGGSLNPIADPNATFTLYGNTTYSVAFTIHTQAQNSKGNSLGGSTWYDENLYGFFFGVCYPSTNSTSIGPSADVNISIGSIAHPCCSGYAMYQIQFGTVSTLQQPVTFQVNWQPAPSTASDSTIPGSSVSSTTPSTTSSSTSSSVTPSISNIGTSAPASYNTTAAIATAPATSSSSAASSNSAGTSSAAPVNRASPSFNLVDVIAATGLGVVMAYAIGHAMIRKLK